MQTKGYCNEANCRTRPQDAANGHSGKSHAGAQMMQMVRMPVTSGYSIMKYRGNDLRLRQVNAGTTISGCRPQTLITRERNISLSFQSGAICHVASIGNGTREVAIFAKVILHEIAI